MEQRKIGKIIAKIRKEKELTQQELGDLLGVSSKTISKWETGNGLPDVTILKKISEEFNITIEELLDGKIEIQKNDNKNSKKLQTKKIISVSILLLIITTIIIIISIKYQNNKQSEIPQNNCTVIKTYNIKNIEKSNDENYLYITISEYQVEGVYTVKLPKSISEDLNSGKSYVFTFKTNEENTKVTADILFNNSEIINIKYTDKIGMDSENRSFCDKTVTE